MHRTALLALTLLLSTSTRAEEPVGPSRIDINIDELFDQTEKLNNTDDTDSVWSLRAADGNVLLSVPIRITLHADRTIQLNSSTIRINNARFVCWKLQRPDEPLPINPPPHIAGQISITPQGKATWKLDRRFRGGAIKANAGLYPFKIEVQRVRALKEKALNAQPAERRDALARVTKLIRDVNQLPKEITTDMPDRIYAIFELSDNATKLSIGGPTPLPWRIDLNKWNTMRAGAEPIADDEWKRDDNGKADTSQLPKARQRAVRVMVDTIGEHKHPYDLRLCARVLAQSGMVNFAESDRALFSLVDSVLTSADPAARSSIRDAIMTTIPPTDANIRLARRLRQASAKPIGPIWPKDLGKPDNNRLKQLVEAANIQLIDDDGPVIRLMLEKILDLHRRVPKARHLLVNHVQFDKLAENRLRQSILFTLNHAATDELAARWLNDRFLASDNKTVVKMTLRLLQDAELLSKK